jgi:hypothetical protein
MKRISILVFILLAFASAAIAKPVLLRYTFSPGDDLYYGMDATGTGRMESSVIDPDGAAQSGGEKIPLDIKLRVSLENSVDSIDKDGVATIRVILHEYRMSQGGADIINFNADSDSESSGEENKNNLKELYKSPIVLKMDPLGKIESVSGVENFSGDISQSDMKTLLEESQHQFPEKPVDVGDSWTHEMNLDLGADAAAKEGAVTKKYKFVGYETVKDMRCAKIAFQAEGDLSTIFNALPLDVPAENLDVREMKISYSGNLYFAPDEGLLVAFEFTMNQYVNAVMSVDLNSKPTKVGMKLDMALKGTYELE